MSKNLHASPSLDVVILSAGESSRLGQPKQHSVVGSQKLLERALILAGDISDALSFQRQPVLVSGAYLQQDCQALAVRTDQRPVTHLYNANWRRGMSSSLECARPWATADGVLVLLVDQYLVQPDDLMAMYAQWSRQSGRPMAARYAQTLGPPVIWPQRLWASEGTTDDHRKRLNKSALMASSPRLFDLPAAAADLDTADDLSRAQTINRPLKKPSSKLR